eukprot:CAMPEP_0116032272 /NCGR_PEP_ID=MMETSP0321-20121206/18066_1 /TAXON_ID=163516 /ORGANISM="Leptocylindrus danicus var. danicus, Strain B650" /LENGTH=429 /DNA_ID=CAMNT_0003507667 /DNA_START=46 /DNA_END=1335 /DNA_ORIENTATION=+
MVRYYYVLAAFVFSSNNAASRAETSPTHMNNKKLLGDHQQERRRYRKKKVHTSALGAESEHHHNEVIDSEESSSSTPVPVLITPHIVNGGDVGSANKYPFMVYAGGCGASLVAPNVVLSAAHCAGSINEVSIGRYNLNDVTESYETFGIAEKVIHPNYNPDTLDYDYMMMRLEGSTSSYAPVALDDGSVDVAPGTDLIVMGWGATSSEGPSSPILQEVVVDAKSQAECNGAYNPSGYDITDRMMCAARSTNGVNKDSCQGDSGGPMIDSSSGKQVGIVSWGFSCADPNFPGVYARVSDQIDWIEGYIDEWSESSSPSSGSCVDTPGFIDKYGDGCEWYEKNDPECQQWGNACCAGEFGSPNVECCYCGGGTIVTPAPVTPAPATPAPIPSFGSKAEVQEAIDLMYKSIASSQAIIDQTNDSIAILEALL